MAAGDLVTLAEFKTFAGLTDGLDDGRIPGAITVASRWLASECGREFYQASDATPTARRYRPPAGQVLTVHDFSTTTGLVVVDDAVPLVLDTDFYVAPLNGVSATGETVAYTELRLMGSSVWRGLSPDPTVTVTAQWGWASVPVAVKQGVVEIVNDLMATPQSKFGVIGIDLGTAFRLRMNTHVAQLIGTYMNSAKAPGFGIA